MYDNLTLCVYTLTHYITSVLSLTLCTYTLVLSLAYIVSFRALWTWYSRVTNWTRSTLLSLYKVTHNTLQCYCSGTCLYKSGCYREVTYRQVPPYECTYVHIDAISSDLALTCSPGNPGGPVSPSCPGVPGSPTKPYSTYQSNTYVYI